MTHTLRYTRLSPLFDEMSLAAESNKNSGLMNLDSFPGNRVYHLPKSVSFNEKRPRKPETNIQKRFEGMKSKFLPGIFQPGKQPNAFSDVPFLSRIIL